MDVIKIDSNPINMQVLDYHADLNMLSSSMSDND
jgi:hypothetical protein